jgi:hypothetical protein
MISTIYSAMIFFFFFLNNGFFRGRGITVVEPLTRPVMVNLGGVGDLEGRVSDHLSVDEFDCISLMNNQCCYISL